jgi:hypothetical protein
MNPLFQVKNPTAQSYLEQHLPDIKNDAYALAVASYALYLAGSTKKDEALRLLDQQRVSGSGENDLLSIGRPRHGPFQAHIVQGVHWLSSLRRTFLTFSA